MRDTFSSFEGSNCVSPGKSTICQEIPTKMHVIVNKDHRESSWNSVGAFLDDFRTINLDLGPKSRFSAAGPTSATSATI